MERQGMGKYHTAPALKRRNKKYLKSLVRARLMRSTASSTESGSDERGGKLYCTIAFLTTPTSNDHTAIWIWTDKILVQWRQFIFNVQYFWTILYHLESLGIAWLGWFNTQHYLISGKWHHWLWYTTSEKYSNSCSHFMQTWSHRMHDL